MNKVGNMRGIRRIGVEFLGNITLVSSTTIKGDRWLKERLMWRVKGAVRCDHYPHCWNETVTEVVRPKEIQTVEEE